MRSLGGLVLLAGIGVGLFVYLPAPVDRDTSLDNARRLAAEHAVQSRPAVLPAAAPGSRSFSPAISLTSMARRQAPATAPPDAPVATSEGWQTTATASSATAQTGYRSLEPGNPESRYRLVVDIQQQLKRLGCYYGRIDGSWGGNSKDAMQSFMARVNSALPTEAPDYMLLTLLQAHSGKVCGACPADQVLTSGGRCVPQAIVAHAQRNDGGPLATAPKEVLPWQAAGVGAKQAPTRPLFTPLPTSVVSSQPLPGRMAIGGPRTLPPVDSVYEPNTAAGAPGVATAALDPGAPGVAPPVAAAPAAQKPRTSYKRSRRDDGPGTPRYNLLLSLGGAY